MVLFFSILYQKWLDIKLWTHLNFRYPYKQYHANIRYILPSDLKLNKGIVIEKRVKISAHLEEISKYVFIGNNTQIDLW